MRVRGGIRSLSLTLSRSPVTCSISDDGTQAIARVQRLQRLRRRLHAVELVRDKVLERDLTLDSFLDEHWHRIARLPAANCEARHVSAASSAMHSRGADTHAVRAIGYVGGAHAVPVQHRPVMNWNGRVAISLPEAATPMMVSLPHPRCAASSAERITSVLPVQSNV